jgi:WD40 repeat protein
VRWHLPTQTITARARMEPSHLTADPTGAFVAALDLADGTISLLDASSLRRVYQLVVDGSVSAAAFDPTGQRLAVVGSAGLYVFWLRP